MQFIFYNLTLHICGVDALCSQQVMNNLLAIQNAASYITGTQAF